jgi:hypothetical protein
MAIWLVAVLAIVKPTVGFDEVMRIGESRKDVSERESTLA